MGMVMIHCPKTEKAISTGMQIDRVAFVGRRSSSAVPFVRRAAPHTSGLPRCMGLRLRPREL